MQIVIGQPPRGDDFSAGQFRSKCHASPLTVRVGGRTPWIDATISSTRRVGPTSCTRNIAAPSAAAKAVAASVPSSRHA